MKDLEDRVFKVCLLIFKKKIKFFFCLGNIVVIGARLIERKIQRIREHYVKRWESVEKKSRLVRGKYAKIKLNDITINNIKN